MNAFESEIIVYDLVDSVIDGNLPKAEMLIKVKKADPNKRISSGSPFEIACKLENLDMMELLYELGGRIDFESDEGKAFLFDLIRHDQDRAIKFFLERGLPMNLRFDPGKNTMLHIASDFDSRNVAALLVSRGADVDARNIYNQRPIDKAASRFMRDLLRVVTLSTYSHEQSN
ncbi:MAG: ankyrin repeat domain-containing protein [Nitrososphaerota archaeon]